MIGGNAARVKDSVTDALEPAVKSVDSLKQEIKKKKTMTIYDNKLISWIKNKLNGKQEIDKG